MEPIATSTDLHRRRDAYSGALAYVWGRQDGGESDRDTGYSTDFADAYALAEHVSGQVSTLQGSHQEWSETGRLVRVTESGLIVQIVKDEAHSRAVAHPIPWAGNRYGLPYWPGHTRRPELLGAAESAIICAREDDVSTSDREYALGVYDALMWAIGNERTGRLKFAVDGEPYA